MNDANEMNSQPTARRSIGGTVATKRKQLAHLTAEKKRKHAAYILARERLARDLAELEGHERRRQRVAELNEEKRVRFILGGIWLQALQSQPSSFSLSLGDLTQLKPVERVLLDAVLARTLEASSPADLLIGGATPTTATPVDVVL